MPETVASSPRTSPSSTILRISVLPADEEVQSFARPLQRMKMPRGFCPSTNKRVPLGYVLAAVIEESTCTAGGERLQKSRSCRNGQAKQLSTMHRPYGVRCTPSRSVIVLRLAREVPNGSCFIASSSLSHGHRADGEFHSSKRAPYCK